MTSQVGHGLQLFNKESKKEKEKEKEGERRKRIACFGHVTLTAKNCEEQQRTINWIPMVLG